jgi:glycosyltransferase involved in cell wall biosynthesis
MRSRSAEQYKQLTILSVSYPLLTVGCGAAGGAEEILRLIDEGLTGCGFRSIVVASAGSKIAGRLVSTLAANGEITEELRARAQEVQQAAVESVLGEESVDLIHFHGLDFLAYRPRGCVPQLATLHLPVSWYPADLFQQPKVTFNFVSQTQAASVRDQNAIPVISNGIDLSRLPFSRTRDDYLLWVGRICAEKAPHIALRVAHHLDLPLVMAGPLHAFASHEQYFHEKVEPQLDERRKYVGPVSGAVKAQLLGRASCLLIPSLAAETSSLVAMESIACGTPVIAFRSGALPEVVEDGVTGFIVDGEEEMMRSVTHTAELDPEVCRMTAERRFSGTRMVNEYVTLYRQLIAGKPSLLPRSI